MKRVLLAITLFCGAASAQWTDFTSSTASSVLIGAMNGKLNWQTGSGNPNGSFAGTAGKDAFLDSTNLVGYICTVTGTTSTAVWKQLAMATETWTVGTGGVTANTCVQMDTSNPSKIIAGTTGCYGIAVSTVSAAGSVEVTRTPYASCVTDTGGSTAGDLAIQGTGTTIDCKDSGQTTSSAISIGTRIIGVFRQTVTAGNPALIELTPSHFGTKVDSINGTSLAGLATGLLKNTTTTGVPSIAATGTDYQAPITLTTTGTSGAATFTSGTLNIPQYTGGSNPFSYHAYTGTAAFDFSTYTDVLDTASGANPTITVSANPATAGLPVNIGLCNDTTARSWTLPSTFKRIGFPAIASTCVYTPATWDGTNYQGPGTDEPPSVIRLTTERAAPATPAASTGVLWPDSTDHDFEYMANNSASLFKMFLAGADCNPVTGICTTSNGVANVTTTGTQTVTNKTIDGVTPTTMGYVDPTSSIQTQLNAKASSSATTTVNGATCALGGSCAPYGGVVTYTANHTVGAADIGKLVVMNCTSTCALTFKAAPAATDWFGVETIGSTVATVSLNSLNYNGASSVPVLNNFRDLRVASDGSNYFGDAPLVAGANVTITPASNGATIAASATGSTAFSALTGSTNTTAAMVVGTGASLAPTGTGTVNANQLNAGTVPASAVVLGSNSSSQPVAATTTGSGTTVVLATSPTLVTPALGVASATTINKVTLTAPATGSTLTVADGKTLTTSNTLTLAGTDATTMTFPTTSATLARTDAANTFTGHQTIEGVTSAGATGTSNLVFSNSPTLVTPALGTPSALVLTNATGLPNSALTTAANTRMASCSFDGGGSTITTNSVCYTRVPVAATIIGWAIEAQGSSPGCTIDVLKIASGGTLPTSSIAASALPALTSTNNAAKSSTLTGWTTSISADDMMGFKVTTPGAATWASIHIYYTVN